jgi:hypothetical protein
MRQITSRMTVSELQIEMEIQALRERVAKLEAIVRDLTAAPECTRAHVDFTEE